MVERINTCTRNEKQRIASGNKNPYKVLFGVPMKMEIANSVLSCNLTIKKTIEEDLINVKKMTNV